jgi:Arc/MetJ-type ribon-helix-helix transcriptional regulator
MSATQQLTITLPIEIVEAVKSKVASGEFASESDVLSASFLYFAQADDSFGMDEETFNEFLRREAVPVLEAMDADPSLGLSLEQVRANLADAHTNFRKAG